MRISCDLNDYISIERAEPSDDDVLVVVEVRCRGFVGRIDTWILRDVWIDFCRQLSTLEERRQGEATIESISPKELRVTFRSTDRAGHMAVDGHVGYRGARGEALLSFSPMPFEPSMLPSLVREARAIAG
jgi:hypothetical protein